MKQIPIGDTTLSVFDDGRGPVVLFVHGFPLDHTMWIEQLSALAADYRVIAPDLRGFGGSAPVEGVLSMEQLANDCAALLDVLGIHEPITFAGLSMGGYVAWQFALQHASLLGKLVLCDTRAAADNPAGVETRLKMAEHVLAHGTDAVAEAMPLKIFGQHTLEHRDDRVESIRATIRNTRPATIAAAQRGMAARPDVTALLPTIRVPTLVIVGEEDTISPRAEMQAIAESIPGARLQLISQDGHVGPLEQPGQVNRALCEFLRT